MESMILIVVLYRRDSCILELNGSDFLFLALSQISSKNLNESLYLYMSKIPVFPNQYNISIPLNLLSLQTFISPEKRQCKWTVKTKKGVWHSSTTRPEESILTHSVQRADRQNQFSYIKPCKGPLFRNPTHCRPHALCEVSVYCGSPNNKYRNKRALTCTLH